MVAIIDVLREVGGDSTLATIASVGGEDALYSHADEISCSDVVDVAATILAANWDQVNHERAKNLLVSGIRSTQDPLAFAGTIKAIFSSADIINMLARELNEALLARAEMRKDSRQAHIAVDALDGALKLALLGVARPFRLLELITSVTTTEPPAFAIAVARRLGAIYIHMREESARAAARDALTTLASHQEARSDAFHQLGTSGLVDALETDNAEGVEQKLRHARTMFTAAVDIDADRIDAKLYASALDGVLALVDRLPVSTVRAAAEEVEDLAIVRTAWKSRGRLEEWLGDSTATEQEWWMVSAAFARACNELDDERWLKASRSLAAIARAHEAANTAAVLPYAAPGLRVLVAPRLVAPFVTSTYRWSLLKRWAEEMRTHPELSADASGLLEAVTQDPKDEKMILISEIRSQLPDPEKLDMLMESLMLDQQTALERRLETLDGQDSVLHNEAARRLSRDLRKVLEGSPDYQGTTRVLFDRIIDITIRYAVARTNIEASFAKGGFRFLHDPNALEQALQIDYWNYLISSTIGDVVDIETSHVGGGRADIRFTFGGIRIVAELKRDKNPTKKGQLDPYLNQAGLYQSSNVALGLLMVLDLSPKPKGQVRSLGTSFWVAEKPDLAEGDTVRSIVTILIPGNRPTPSAVSHA
ncbi:hypothetical protein OG339_42875 [Streptosporangium sp. NBC_01495]|uniref:hypothetical protein n=1 Tax=Streptosporangium sp. NBC_01495 TaxID=2903899 RepID=UPI002E3144A5|nr:hypothetical protein [Streptosporangium sp. NBC_01495]